MTAVDRISQRSGALTYQEILDTDTHPVPDVLRLTSDAHFTDADIPVTRYTSRAFHELEKEKLWDRVWQMACRSEDIPEVGDTHRYDIADRSYLIVRTAAEEIKGYYNACLHRGRMLREFDGRVEEIRCPFHGFCWELDGSLKEVPSGWDFPHVFARSEEFQLPEVNVDTWGGFVFINPDENCESLASFLGELPDQFARTGIWRTGTRAPTWRRSSAAIGRWHRRRSPRRFTSLPRTHRSSRASVTPTPSTTCGATSVERSLPTTRRARTCAGNRRNRRCSTFGPTDASATIPFRSFPVT